MPPRFPLDPAAYHAAALDVFETAAAALGGAIAQDYDLAGLKIRMRFAGSEAAHVFGRAFSHLAVPVAAKPDLTLHIWDSETSGTPALQSGWGVEDYNDFGEIPGFNDDRFRTLIETNPQSLRMVDSLNGTGINWVRDLRQIPYTEMAAPLRPLLHDWFWRQNRMPIHGGAVGLAAGGVLLVGAGGAGKSNTAMACVNSVLKYASDDFCVLSCDPVWRVHSLYSSGKLRDGDFTRQPGLVPMIDPTIRRPEGEKHILFINEHHPEALLAHLPIRALVAPRVVGGSQCRLVPTSGARIQQALAVSTMKMAWATAARTFEAAAALVRALPCYELQLAPDMTEVPAILHRLLDELS